MNTQSRFAACLVVAVVVIACGGGGGGSKATPKSNVDRTTLAVLALGDAIAKVRDPDIIVVGGYSLMDSDHIAGHQPRLLNGPNGLLNIRDTLISGDATRACDELGELVRGQIVNRLMVLTGGDVYRFTRKDAEKLDPDGVFLGITPRTIRLAVRDTEEIIGIDPSDGDVVSVVWRSLAEDLVRLVYGLGENCVEAARR